MADIPGVPAGYTLRIPLEAFVGFISAFLAIAILSASARTAFRLKHTGALRLDDWFLLLSIILVIACAGVAYSLKDLIYLAIYVGVKWVAPPPDFLEQMLEFEKRLQVCSALIWLAIYAVKFSFMFYFKKLVSRVRKLELWWWVVMVTVTAGGAASVPLAFIVCTDFSMSYLESCPVEFQLHNEKVYLTVTTAIDVLTDVLIISVPVSLLWNVQISLRRKLGLGSMLCLSAFMIIIAIVRSTLAPLPNGIVDTSWLFFWQGIEAATAIILVSLTAFPALFGQDGSKPSGNKKSPKPLSPASWSSGGRSSKKGSLKGATVRSNKPWKRFNLPSIPSATLTGMRTYVGSAGEDDRTVVRSVDEEKADLDMQKLGEMWPMQRPEATASRPSRFAATAGDVV